MAVGAGPFGGLLRHFSISAGLPRSLADFLLAGCVAVQNPDNDSAATSSSTSDISTAPSAATFNNNGDSVFRNNKKRGNRKHRRQIGAASSLANVRDLVERELEGAIGKRALEKQKRELHVTFLKRSLATLVERGLKARALTLTAGDLEDLKVRCFLHGFEAEAYFVELRRLPPVLQVSSRFAIFINPQAD